MLSIVLLHDHYDPSHLEAVKAIMQTKGAPKIRCLWSDLYGCWLAVEGCHRLRAAHELGLTPKIIDVSNQKTVTYQTRDGRIRKETAVLLEELNDNAVSSTMLDFAEQEGREERLK